MLLDNLFNAPVVGKLIGVVFELNKDRRAAVTLLSGR